MNPLENYVNQLLLTEENAVGNMSGVPFYDTILYTNYVKTRNVNCGADEGSTLSRCKMNQSRQAMILLKRNKNSCSKSKYPEKCKANSDALISKWQSKYDFFRGRETNG